MGRAAARKGVAEQRRGVVRQDGTPRHGAVYGLDPSSAHPELSANQLQQCDNGLRGIAESRSSRAV